MNQLSFLEKAGIIPEEFLIKRDVVFRFLEPFARELDIEIELVENLPELEYAQRTMRNFF